MKVKINFNNGSYIEGIADVVEQFMQEGSSLQHVLMVTYTETPTTLAEIRNKIEDSAVASVEILDEQEVATTVFNQYTSIDILRVNKQYTDSMTRLTIPVVQR